MPRSCILLPPHFCFKRTISKNSTLHRIRFRSLFAALLETDTKMLPSSRIIVFIWLTLGLFVDSRLQS